MARAPLTRPLYWLAAGLALLLVACLADDSDPIVHERTPQPTIEEMIAGQYIARTVSTLEEAAVANRGCLSCHQGIASHTMHPERSAAVMSCIDCHGGNQDVMWDGALDDQDDPLYHETKWQAHGVRPRFPEAWANVYTGEYSSANPIRSYTLLNYESPEFIRFVNPGDLRVAHLSCGQCHMGIVQRVRNSMMTHGTQLWTAALYNNGSYPSKIARFGESYTSDGVPQRLYSMRRPTGREREELGMPDFYYRYYPTAADHARGVLDYLDPLPRWEIAQMGNILRAFERGGEIPRIELEVGLPNPLEEPGLPDMKLSDRGLGTQLATDPVFLGIQKTRLLDPLLSFFGTNDHPGDFRSSGCTACHVIYANDRNPVHSGHHAVAGNTGQPQSDDPTIPEGERGHPITHEMTSAIPSSQCVVCHVHPGTSFANTYYGYTWWDNETHGELMYPKEQRHPTAEEYFHALSQNPEGSSVRGLWSNLWPGAEDHEGNAAVDDFLAAVSEEVNPKMNKTQFADFHGHGWIFRAIFKKDRQGNLLDRDGDVVEDVTPAKLMQAVDYHSPVHDDQPPDGLPVHLKDIHLERGMHCVDCHFEQDVHGDGKLYGEVRDAIQIDCIDCHGTISKYATLMATGPAGGADLTHTYNTFKRRFDWRDGKLYQRSAVDPDLEWLVPQIKDAVDPSKDAYNEKAAYAKTMQKTGSWNDPSCPNEELAHTNDNMTCYACHTSWMTSCFGCHLPMRANMRMPMLHNEGEVLRNFTQYNYQVLRDDIFMIGRDGRDEVEGRPEGGRIAPVRSSSAVIVGSANNNREWLYSQQQTVSAEGYSGQAFNPHFPHAVRTTETRRCTDCHVADANDNNAWMAQTLLQGTNMVNFLGRFVYVAAGDDGFEAVVVSEREEPQAIIGSTLHKLAYPEHYEKHHEHHKDLQEHYHHGNYNGLLFNLLRPSKILDLQLRGEYLYTARGQGGFYAYDVANVDNKGFSERITTAPFSPAGQHLGVYTKYATSVAAPSTLAVDPTRMRYSTDPSKPPTPITQPAEPHHVNREQPIHPVYAFIYVSDRIEGLVVVGDRTEGVGTLLDGDPMNNFLRRAGAFNPHGKLDGAEYITLAGHYAYMCCDRGLMIIDLDQPLKPKIVAEITDLNKPRAVAVQFRYAFVTDADGLKVVDVTTPSEARLVPDALVPFEDAHRLYIARTYAYVAAGPQGLAIVDIENPETPTIDQFFTADGKINDTHDVKIGMTNASVFAYLADGHNGLQVVELMSPHDTPGFDGFSPRPTPRLIAHHHTKKPAVAISKGLDRDRAVDETGHQTAVFARLGSRPLTLEEQQALYMREGEVYRVKDAPDDATRVEPAPSDSAQAATPGQDHDPGEQR